MDKNTTANNIPLVVDLDGTLLRTDILYEGALLLLKRNPFYFFSILLWAFKGKLFLKQQIAANITLKYDLLPANKELLNFLQTEKRNGRRLVLATASLATHANAIAKVYPIFEKVIGSETVNVKGKEKLQLLLENYRAEGFDYIGDAAADLVIFQSCRFAYLVNPSKKLEATTRRIANLQHVWRQDKPSIKDFMQSIRAYQWIKNVLIFVPLITSHSLHSFNLIVSAIEGFFAFSLAASAGYLINDLLDLEADRRHPRKKMRPFASGNLPIPFGIAVSILLLISAAAIGMFLPPLFLLVLLLYFCTSFAYSFYFKKIVLYDVFILALLYSSRIIAGGVVTGIAISFWLIAFSTFIFLSLAFVKRYSELMKTSAADGLQERGREYAKEDLALLQMMGIVSGFCAVVVFSLYIDSPEVVKLYSHPKTLWAISLLFLFWISRIWVITNRGQMTDDPIVFTIKDRSSYFVFLTTGFILWMAT